MSIKQQLKSMQEQLEPHVTLVAVSKTKPEADIMEAYETGQRCFGENKVQDLVTKYENLPKDIEWHFIGHLQTNKIKYIASFVSLIHAVDSVKLLNKIQSEAVKHKRIIPCLLQAKVALEDTKFGLPVEEIEAILAMRDQYPNVLFKGIMGMATNTKDVEQVVSEFEKLKSLFDKYKSQDFNELSMGMSGDWPLAIKQGSTMIRVGSTIFGTRNYK